MPSLKAKENKTLATACAGCGKTFSTEMLSGVMVGTGRRRRLVPLCEACRPAGWFRPPQEAGA